MQKTDAMTEAESAFWIFYEAANNARLNASEGAKVAGISRSNWYLWITRKTTPYEYHVGRLRRATVHLRACVAEKSLPAMTSAKRRALVVELIKKLDEAK